MRFHQELMKTARKRIEDLGFSKKFTDDELYEISYLMASDAVVCMDKGIDKYTDEDWRDRNASEDFIAYRKSQLSFTHSSFPENSMITIEQSYKDNMSSAEFYEAEKVALFRLIKKKRCYYYVMSRSWESGIYCCGIELLGGFLLTDDGDIVSPERWMPADAPEPESKRKPVKPSIRFQILKRDNYACKMCGASATDGAKLEIDHITPVSRGGQNNEENLQVLCRDCNIGKSDSFQ